MKNYLPLTRFLVLVLFISSCAPATVSPVIPPTPRAAALPTFTAVPAPYTATPRSLLSVETIDYHLPDQLAERITIENLPELISPITNEPEPRHIDLTLEKYAIETASEAGISIYSVDDAFRSEDPRRTALQNVIAGKAGPQDYLDAIDLFGVDDIKVRPQKVSFQNGSGVSYLYYWGVGGPGVPVNNDRLIYTFDGLTNDNKYFVQVSLPVRVPFLDNSIDMSQPLGSAPPGIVPYPDFGDQDSINEYYNTLYSKLGSADANIFSPSLDTLDAFISSLLLVIKE